MFEKSCNNLEGKDLVTIGIFSVIYFVSMMVVGFLGFIPIFIPLLAVLVPILGGIPFILFVSKVRKFGMITIFSLINGILMLVTGMGVYSIFTGLIFGGIADFNFKAGAYRGKLRSIITYAIFSMWLFGNFIPFFVGREAQFSMLNQGYGQEYTNALEALVPMWSAPILLISCFIFGLVGGIIGVKTCKKHFERAGIA